jgi:superfamily II DNA/RNA helicase
VFTRTRHGADRLTRQLDKRGLAVVAMHGGRNQNQRRQALEAFAAGRATALIATDVAARGIHVDDVALVVHFDPAQDHKDYVHRSGRTARAGAGGMVVTMVTPDQRRAIGHMQRELGLEVPIERPRAVGSHTSLPSDRQPARIFVGNLPWRTSERDLHRLFSSHGNVISTSIVRHNGRSKGYGFVDMTGTHAPAAVAALAGSELAGRRLQVRPAR